MAALENEALAPYLTAIRAGEPLGREEERDLARRARRGDARARDELVKRHLGLVVMVARKVKRGSLRLEELVQEGNLGLLRAVEKYDPESGNRFSTYAVWWVRAYVWKYLKEARSAVRPKSGNTALADVSLDAAVHEDEGDVSFLDRIEDGGPGPDEQYAANEGDRRVRASLQQVRRRVGEMGWDIIHSRLQRDPPDTLEQIGRRWNVSRERVRQVEMQTKRFLARWLDPSRPDGERKAA